jgi:hypothetical protein
MRALGFKTIKESVMKLFQTLLFMCIFLVGCAGSSMSIKQSSKPIKKIETLAIASGSGVLGDAIGLELFNLGIRVVDASQANSIIGHAGLSEFEITTSRGYTVLREKGIDAVLSAKAILANDGTPESASVRITDTQEGDLIAGVSWENGWGGQRGSMADRTMRDNMSQAAQEIAEELFKRLNTS